MSTSSRKSLAALGFLSILEIDDVGYCGGLLILDLMGHPIEFHCTLPVKPNRTQEILYGVTLKRCLYGDQITRALIEKAKTPARLLLTDTLDVTREGLLTPMPQRQRSRVCTPLLPSSPLPQCQRQCQL